MFRSIIILNFLWLPFQVTFSAKPVPYLNAHFTEFACRNLSPDIVQSLTCTLNPPRVVGSPSLYMDVRYNRDIYNMTLKLKIDFGRGKKIETYRLMKLDLCTSANNILDNLVLKMFFIELNRVGNFPLACPLKKDKDYYLHNFTLDSSALPSYLPEGNFFVTSTLSNKEKELLSYICNGRFERNVKANNRKPKG